MGFKRPARVLFLGRDTGAPLAAQALARRLGEGWIEARAAGLHGKPLRTADLAWADLVVTLDRDARERCPALPPQVQTRHFECGEAADPEALREILRRRIEGMIGGLRMLERDAREPESSND